MNGQDKESTAQIVQMAADAVHRASDTAPVGGRQLGVGLGDFR